MSHLPEFGQTQTLKTPHIGRPIGTPITLPPLPTPRHVSTASPTAGPGTGLRLHDQGDIITRHATLPQGNQSQSMSPPVLPTLPVPTSTTLSSAASIPPALEKPVHPQVDPRAGYTGVRRKGEYIPDDSGTTTKLCTFNIGAIPHDPDQQSLLPVPLGALLQPAARVPNFTSTPFHPIHSSTQAYTNTPAHPLLSQPPPLCRKCGCFATQGSTPLAPSPPSLPPLPHSTFAPSWRCGVCSSTNPFSLPHTSLPSITIPPTDLHPFSLPSYTFIAPPVAPLSDIFSPSSPTSISLATSPLASYLPPTTISPMLHPSMAIASPSSPSIPILLLVVDATSSKTHLQVRTLSYQN